MYKQNTVFARLRIKQNKYKQLCDFNEAVTV